MNKEFQKNYLLSTAVVVKSLVVYHTLRIVPEYKMYSSSYPPTHHARYSQSTHSFISIQYGLIHVPACMQLITITIVA